MDCLRRRISRTILRRDRTTGGMDLRRAAARSTLSAAARRDSVEYAE
jgi:hypothetical protein